MVQRKQLAVCTEYQQLTTTVYIAREELLAPWSQKKVCVDIINIYIERHRKPALGYISLYICHHDGTTQTAAYNANSCAAALAAQKRHNNR